MWSRFNEKLLDVFGLMEEIGPHLLDMMVKQLLGQKSALMIKDRGIYAKLPPEKAQEAATQFVQKVAGLVNNDRTKARYIVGQVAMGHMDMDKVDEDLERIVFTIDYFERHRRAAIWKERVAAMHLVAPGKDILNIFEYNNWRDLETLVHELDATQLKSNRQAAKDIKTFGARIVFTVQVKTQAGLKEFVIREITSPEAADEYGKGTKWCTSTWKSKYLYASNYLKTGPLYQVYKRLVGEQSETPYIQFQADGSQFCDINDRGLTETSAAMDKVLSLFALEVPRLYPSGADTHVYNREDLAGQENHDMLTPKPGVKHTIVHHKDFQKNC